MPGLRQWEQGESMGGWGGGSCPSEADAIVNKYRDRGMARLRRGGEGAARGRGPGGRRVGAKRRRKGPG